MEGLVWCLLTVLPLDSNELVETAVQGKVVGYQAAQILVDFSEYAAKKGYANLQRPVLVNSGACTEDR